MEVNGTVVVVAAAVNRTGGVGPSFTEVSTENGLAVSLHVPRGDNCARPSAS